MHFSCILLHLVNSPCRFGFYAMIVELVQKYNFTLWPRNALVASLTILAEPEGRKIGWLHFLSKISPPVCVIEILMLWCKRSISGRPETTWRMKIACDAELCGPAHGAFGVRMGLLATFDFHLSLFMVLVIWQLVLQACLPSVWFIKSLMLVAGSPVFKEYHCSKSICPLSGTLDCSKIVVENTRSLLSGSYSLWYGFVIHSLLFLKWCWSWYEGTDHNTLKKKN